MGQYQLTSRFIGEENGLTPAVVQEEMKATLTDSCKCYVDKIPKRIDPSLHVPMLRLEDHSKDLYCTLLSRTLQLTHLMGKLADLYSGRNSIYEKWDRSGDVYGVH